jgi:hypothetical protein
LRQLVMCRLAYLLFSHNRNKDTTKRLLITARLGGRFTYN